MSFAMMGRSIGAVVFPAIVAKLIHEYGFSGVYLILSALYFHYVACGALFRQPDYMVTMVKQARKEELSNETSARHNQPEGEHGNKDIQSDDKHYSVSKPSSLQDTTDNTDDHQVCVLQSNSVELKPEDKGDNVGLNEDLKMPLYKRLIDLFGLHLLKQSLYVAFCLNVTLSSATIVTVVIFSASFAKSVGVTEGQMLVGMSLWGATAVFVRPIVGLLFDLPKVKVIRTHAYCIILLLFVVLQIATPLVRSFPTYLIYMLLLAALVSVLTTQEVVIYGDLVSRKYYPNAVGLAGIFKAVGTLLGPVFAGEHTL